MLSAAVPMLGPIVGGIIAATVGGVIAIRAINANRAIARLRATLDTIERSESQDHYKKLAIAFRDFRRTDSVERVLHPQTDEDRAIRTDVLLFLNHYELIAVGLDSGVLDKAFYAEYMRGTVLRNWKTVKPLIDRMRAENAIQNPRPTKIYEHFEGLAGEWEWEVRHEEYCKRLGLTEAEIRKSIAYFREHPTAPRPPR
jgi:hypothetical protein